MKPAFPEPRYRPVQLARLQEVFQDCLTTAQSMIPPSRESALVMTKLQEAYLWACQGLALEQEDAE